MKKTQSDYIGTPKTRKPDEIEIFGTGLPRDYIKKPKFLDRSTIEKDDRFIFFVLLMTLLILIIGISILQSRKVAYIESQVIILQNDMLDFTPVSTPTPSPTPTLAVTSSTSETSQISETASVAPIVYESRTFKITAYCACIKCCKKTDGITASGIKVQEGVTCAADLSVLPLGTVVDIEGIGLRTVQDKGSKVKGDHLDIFVNDHKLALAFGVQYRMVTIFEKEGK